MEQSLNESSKTLIPLFAAGHDRILDVGCADGALLQRTKEISENSFCCGIDINPDMIKKGIGRCADIEFSVCAIEDVAEQISDGMMQQFDCVIFSSVLHEISSYACEGSRYTCGPVIDALHAANACLCSDGVLIIRDGLRNPYENKTAYVELKNKDDIKYVRSFMQNNPVSGCGADIADNGDNARFFSLYPAVQEFLRTYTWGAESWEREVRELNGVLNFESWTEIIQTAGFDIIQTGIFSDGYAKYLKNKVTVYDAGPNDNPRKISLESFFGYTNGIFIAKKTSVSGK